MIDDEMKEWITLQRRIEVSNAAGSNKMEGVNKAQSTDNDRQYMDGKMKGKGELFLYVLLQPTKTLALSRGAMV